ncbi:hypothetical protein SNE40_014545 [Patella caerulea]|uniref:Amidohydrolase-related domain-containing protein n=1 Tax=Patella caerulea TaxID=87958 RepID=A0AAN8JDR8_PATCE
MATDSFIIKNGRIINNNSVVDMIGDVYVRKNEIISVGVPINTDCHDNGNVAVFDASQCLILSGLIDLHVHAYEYATPLGINIDKYCLARGVTTVVDAGSSGACTFPGLKKFIAERSETRLLCFLHIASHGLAAAGCSGFGAGGECDHLNQVDVNACTTTIAANQDAIVGVKVRLSADVADNGKHEEEVYRRALTAARKCNVPLMVHHTMSTIPVQDLAGRNGLSCPGNLDAGDVYTHTFHGYASSIIDPVSKTVLPAIHNAQKRGVIFDVGHGQGSFSWTAAEIGAKENFWPDTISTDMHSGNIHGPVYDLNLVMSRFLHLGMPLSKIISAVTSTPARVIGRTKTLGSLEVGREADITVLKIVDCDIILEDCQGQVRNIKKRFHPVAVWKSGRMFPIVNIDNCPNEKSRCNGVNEWDKLKVKDENKPSSL